MSVEKRYVDIIEGREKAKTARELMESRYSAYVLGNIDFILESHDPETRKELSKEETEEWAKSSEWLSLEILNTEAGTETDEEGIVEFKVKYIENKVEQLHHEKSKFVKRDGTWFYHGWLPLQGTIVKEKKIGRNDPCTCGSGKKYKKCCGK